MEVVRRYFSSAGPDQRGPNYKPTPLRTPFLASVFIYICSLVALSEYVQNSLPAVDRLKSSDPQPVPWRTSPVATSATPPPPRQVLAQLVSNGTRTAAGATGWDNSTAPAATPAPASGMSAYPSQTDSISRRPGYNTTAPTPAPDMPTNNLRPSYQDYPNLGTPTYISLAAVTIVEDNYQDTFGVWPNYPYPVDETTNCFIHPTLVTTGNTTSACEVVVFDEFGPTGVCDTVINENLDYFAFSGHCRFEREWNEALLRPWKTVSACAGVLGGFRVPLTSVVDLPVPSQPGAAPFIPGANAGGGTPMSTRIVPAGQHHITLTRASFGDIWGVLSTPTTAMEQFVTTLTDSRGVPTATQTEYLQPQTPIPTDLSIFRTKRVTLYDPDGRPTKTLTEYLIPLTGSDGLPSATLAAYLSTLTNADGIPTTTVTKYLTSPGMPRAPPTSHATPTSTSLPQAGTGTIATQLEPASPEAYFTGLFVPIFLAAVLSILVQILDANISKILAFRALTSPRGAVAANSLCLLPGGMAGFATSIRLLVQVGDPMALLSYLLTGSSALLVALSGEAIGLEVYGNCLPIPAFIVGCPISLGFFRGPLRAAEGILVAMAVMHVAVSVLLFRWRSETASDPSSIAATCALLRDEGMKALVKEMPNSGPNTRSIDESGVEYFEGLRFALNVRYQKSISTSGSLTVMLPGGASRGRPSLGRQWSSYRLPGVKTLRSCFSSPQAFGLGFRVVFGLVLCGVLTLVLYYENTLQKTRFEDFMDGQGFGVHFLFAAFGVAITFSWDYLHSEMARLEPYRRLSRRPQLAKDSILVVPATDVFTGLWHSIKSRNVVTGLVAFAGILSKITPILLANVPFSSVVTWKTHQVCSWMAVGILCYMILVLLLSSVLARWPYLPIDPNTIAGRLYYICDSRMLQEFEQKGNLEPKEWAEHLSSSIIRYKLGRMVGVSGQVRLGIDSVQVSEP
ncbi:hypothetical protein GQ53DRAFT_825871 [Thozetella sp. PMI_491]|nr:hypothetical protein GQ53DRAFT_825871 [Thozetella sp. PMI_491]